MLSDDSDDLGRSVVQPSAGRTADPPEFPDGLGGATAVSRNSWRDKIRRQPGLAQAWRIAVFTLGLVFIVFGFMLVVLPGPLTIPPMLIGLWIWSSEFAWARRFFTTFSDKADATWQHAKRHPRSSLAVTIGGLLVAAAVYWAVQHYDLIARIQSLLP